MSGLTLIRYLDLVVLVVALPIFVAAGLPLVAWAALSVAWIAQRWIDAALRRKAREANELKTTMGIVTISMIGRAWLLALTIFGVGLAVSDEAGLSAAVLAIVLLTVSFAVGMIARPFEQARSGEGDRS